MIVRRAHSDDAERLREIAAAAKGHWGYDSGRVERWAAGLDVSPERLRDGELFVAETEGRVVAWAALVPHGHIAWLDDLWVDPEAMGRGIGSLLFRRVLERAGELGATRVEWEAEPNAVGFYERLGGRFVRESEPSEWGRILPVLGLELGGG